MIVTQGGIVNPAGSQVFFTDGVAQGLGIADLSMHAEKIIDIVFALGMKAPQQSRGCAVCKGRAVDPDGGRRNRDKMDGLLPKDGHVLRKLQSGPGRMIAVPVLAAGGDDHGAGNTAELAQQHFTGFSAGVGAVQQVTRKKHQIGRFRFRQLRQTLKHQRLFLAADGGFGSGKALKRRVEMKVRGVDEFNGSHVSLIASALRQRPVSVSTVKIHPSILQGPFADS